jgi:putative heme-binding domain-containing protein
MLSSRNSAHSLLVLSLLLWAAAFHASSSLAQQDDVDDDFEKAAVPGARTFNSTCAGCHGLDGRGSDKGANIAGSDKVRHLSDAEVSAIISNGVAGTGMPGFHNLRAQQIRALVSYVRTLQGKLEARTAPGDATRGKEIFFGKGECSTCHTISGEGGFLGPDLSAYGSAMSAKAIRDEIVRPERNVPAGYRLAVLTTRGGDRLEGVIRNEDNFSVQLQTKDGGYHFFEKSELQSEQPLSQSLMPTNYRQRLTPDELNDLVSYLMNSVPTRGKQRNSHEPEDPAQ